MAAGADSRWREAAEEHRDTLEALAASDLNLQLVDDARALLAELDDKERGRA